MKNTYIFCGHLMTAFTGAMIASLFITHASHWKVYLSIILVCLVVRNVVKDNNQ